MEGVTSAIVAFIFVCVVFPNIVRQKPKFYAALACIVLVIFLTGLDGLIQSRAYSAASFFLVCLLQIAAIVLLILAAGGLSWKQLVGEVNQAIESVRKEAAPTAIAASPTETPPPAAADTAAETAEVMAEAPATGQPRVILTDSGPAAGTG